MPPLFKLNPTLTVCFYAIFPFKFAMIGFAGQRVIEQTIRETLPEGFQRAEYLLEHGMVDMVVHRHELRDTLVRIADMLMNPVAIGEAETLPDAGAAMAGLAAPSTGEAALIDGEPPS